MREEVKSAVAASRSSEKPVEKATKSGAPETDAEVQLGSDPNCNSIECSIHHTLWKEAEKVDGPVVQYPISTAETLDDDLKIT